VNVTQERLGSNEVLVLYVGFVELRIAAHRITPASPSASAKPSPWISPNKNTIAGR